MKPRYTKRHYEDIAEIFRTNRNQLKSMNGTENKLAQMDSLEFEFVELFKRDNNRFQAKKWYKWTKRGGGINK